MYLQAFWQRKEEWKMIKVENKHYDGKCINCGKLLKSEVEIKNTAFYQMTIPLCADCLQECVETLRNFDKEKTQNNKKKGS